MNQVHKENLSQVENALPNRQGLEVEIFGMEGIPQDILDQHRNRILQNFQQAQKDRQIATGNPLPGQAMNNPRKKLKVESASELKKRLEEFRARKKDITANGGVDAAATATENQATFVSFSACSVQRMLTCVECSPLSNITSTLRATRVSCTSSTWCCAALRLLAQLATREAIIRQPSRSSWSSSATDAGWRMERSSSRCW